MVGHSLKLCLPQIFSFKTWNLPTRESQANLDLTSRIIRAIFGTFSLALITVFLHQSWDYNYSQCCVTRSAYIQEGQVGNWKELSLTELWCILGVLLNTRRTIN